MSPPKADFFRPVPGRVSPRFSGIRTFFRLPFHENPKDVDVMIVGVPFDGTSTYRSGSRFAPAAIREISALGRSFHWEARLDIFSKMKVCDGGDFFVNVLNTQDSVKSIQQSAAKVGAAGCKLISIGGDHSITLPLLRAARKKSKHPLCLFHVDAHADTFGPAWGEDFHHGTFVRFAVDEGLIDPKKSIQVGLRGGLAVAEDLEFSQEHGIQILEGLPIQKRPWEETRKSLQNWKKLVGNNPVYVSFDIDAVDPAFAPGTGTPVPGGLFSWQALALLQELKGIHIVGADLVEISPAYDSSNITSLLGMSILFELLTLFALPLNSTSDPR